MAPRFTTDGLDYIQERLGNLGGNVAPDSPIDDALLDAVRWAESRGNNQAISPVGAKGPYQLMDPVGVALHKRLGIQEPYNPYDPKQSRILAKELLHEELNRFGSVPMALAAYNYGSPRLLAAVDRAGGVKDFNAVSQFIPEETRNYVPTVLEKKSTWKGSSDSGAAPVQPVEKQQPLRISSDGLEYLQRRLQGGSDQSSQPTDNRGFFQRNIAGPLSAVGNTITLGGLDELAGALGGGVDVVADKLQRKLRGEYAPFWEMGDREKGIFERAYGETRDVGRKTLAGFREDNPVVSPTLEVAAGLLTPAARAKTLLGMTGLGGLQGFLYGFNDTEGGLAERAEGAGQGGLIGGVGAAGLGALMKGVGALAKSAPVASRFGRVFEAVPERAGELGAVATSGGAKDKISRDIVRGLLKVTSETDAADLQRAKQALGQDDLYNLLDALDDPRVYAEGKYFRQAPGGTSVANKFLEGRTAGVEGRTLDALKRISPEAVPSRGSEKVARGAKALVEQAEKSRTRIADPFYQAAQEAMPIIDNKPVQIAMQSKLVKQTIKQLKDNFPTEYGNLPDNHIKLLDQVKKSLQGKAQALRLQGDKEAAAMYSKLSNQLIKGIDSAGPEYQAARRVFERISPMVDRLKGNKAKAVRGLLEDFMDPTQGDALSAAKKLMSLEADEIRKVKDAFGDGYANDFRAGVRAYLQDVLEKQNFGIDNKSSVDIAKKIMGNRKLKSRIAAALGVTDTHKLQKALEREAQFIKTNRQTFAGSPTAGLLSKDEEWRGFFPALAKMVRSPISTAGDALDTIAGAIRPNRDEFNQQIAEALFVPGRSRDVIDELLKARYGFDKYRAATDRAASGSTAAVTQGLLREAE